MPKPIQRPCRETLAIFAISATPTRGGTLLVASGAERCADLRRQALQIRGRFTSEPVNGCNATSTVPHAVTLAGVFAGGIVILAGGRTTVRRIESNNPPHTQIGTNDRSQKKRAGTCANKPALNWRNRSMNCRHRISSPDTDQ